MYIGWRNFRKMLNSALVVVTILVIIVQCQESATYFGNKIGDFTTRAHNVQGSVYAINDRTLWIRGFSYDGQAPDVFFWAGTSAQPSTSGEIIPDEEGSFVKLDAYDNQNIVITLQTGRIITDYRWISVWCRLFNANFGEVYLPNNFVAPSSLSIGSLGFNPRVHNTFANNVVIVDSKTIRFENLYFDGTPPATYFWVGTGVPSGTGYKVPDENGQKIQPLGAYNGEIITIEFDGDRTVFDIDYISLWCESALANFGDVSIPDRSVLNIPPVYLTTSNGENCEQLSDRLQVLWTVNGDSIDIQLKGTITFGDYMSFGISGSTTRTLMVGSDVAVVWYDGQRGRAVDYNLNAYAQCSGGFGACPDVISSNRGSDDLTGIMGSEQDGVTSISYTRRLNTGDPTDKIITTTGELYVSWSIGQINSDGLAAKHTLRTAVNAPDYGKKIHFGRTPSSTCTGLVAPAQPVIGWDEQLISPDVTVFQAKIGPSGGEKGYSYITGNVGWGIAWYLNGLLIPRLTLKRGTTYTFIVNGGNNPSLSADYHPLYLTNDPAGGLVSLTSEQAVGHVVYAGPSEGPLCQYESITSVDQSAGSATFQDYFNTLSEVCNEPGVSSVLAFTPDITTPDTIYYQCYKHRNLGWKINIVDDTSGGTDDLCTPTTCLNGGTCLATTDGSYLCICQPNYSGTNCQVAGPCSQDPCQNGGTCIITPISYSCNCAPGYAGTNCQTVDSTPCGINPCMNGGVCTNVGVNYTCSCPQFYFGTNCEFVNPCSPTPCLNGGTCDSSGSPYTCTCPPGWAGNNCETVTTTACSVFPCLNGATCVPLGTGFSCNCVTGYVGTTCDTPASCENGYCLNGGTCVFDIQTASPMCFCAIGYAGSRCESAIDGCSTFPCQNAGTCISTSSGSYFCVCPMGYFGQNCEVPPSDPCSPSPCLNGGNCIVFSSTSYFCLCVSGYTGTNCEQGNSCSSGPCQNGGGCSSYVGGYTCSCVNSFSGTNCQTAPPVVDGCSTSPCQNGGTCTAFSNGAYFCNCLTGYSGVNCEVPPSGPCSPTLCQNGASCTVLSSTAYFCTCLSGYSGTNCDQATGECNRVPCLNGGTCVTTGTWYTCTCPVEYMGDNCETGGGNIMPCTSSPCLNGGICSNRNVDTYQCMCPQGFSGTNCDVTPVTQPCTSNPCINGGVCTNVNTNTYGCACPENYSGTNCQIYTAPASGACATAPCLNGGTCQPSGTWYMCQCLPDFMGYDCESGGGGTMPCTSSPCMNGGVCSNVNTATYTCSCQTGYSGMNCDFYTPPTSSPCAANPCLNGGQCTDADSTNYICTCQINYSGLTCQIYTPPTDIGYCINNPCNNGGTCSPSGTWYMCSCPVSFTGSTCDTSIDSGGSIPCSSSPCQNGATCVNINNSYSCTCAAYYEGTNCQTFNSGSSCSPNPCFNGGTCVLSGNAYYCNCLQGLQGYNCDQ